MQLVASYNPDAEAPSQRHALLDEVAFAIWRTWARVGDEEAARSRFGRLHWLHEQLSARRPQPAEGWREALERAYGILWREHGSEKATAARKELLAVLDKDGQRRGIEYAIKRYGPTTEAEILEFGE